MSEALLCCSGLSVRFGGLVALDALDLEVGSGAILGLIGPNGSGKTTLFNVITGVYRAAGGRAQFSGQDLAAELRADRKSTRLNSSHQIISYAVFCLKKKMKATEKRPRRSKIPGDK